MGQTIAFCKHPTKLPICDDSVGFYSVEELYGPEDNSSIFVETPLAIPTSLLLFQLSNEYTVPPESESYPGLDSDKIEETKWENGLTYEDN